MPYWCVCVFPPPLIQHFTHSPDLAVALSEHSCAREVAQEACGGFSAVTGGLALGSGQHGNAFMSSPR